MAITFLCLLCVLGLFASAVVHISSLAGVNWDNLSPAMRWIPVGAIALGFPAVAVFSSRSRKGFRTPRLIVILFIYAFGFFFIESLTIGKAFVEYKDGRYTLTQNSHGNNQVREISRTEYDRHRRFQMAALSAIGLPFYALDMMLLWTEMVARSGEPTKIGASNEKRTLQVSPSGATLPIWAHATVVAIGSGIGFLAGPLLLIAMMWGRPQGHSLFGCFIVPLFFGSAVVGGVLTKVLMEKYIPARCPDCGGIIYCNNGRYHCKACGFSNRPASAKGQ